LRARRSFSRTRTDRKYTFTAGFLAFLLSAPVLALVVIAFGGNVESFSHLAKTVLPSSSITTLILMLGIGLFVAAIGTLTALLVTFYEFPLRNTLQWLLMLPLAVPTYISAYAFVEFFSFTGPLQESVRAIGGYQSSREYWFPEIRSLSGTVLVMGLVLYPYVYLAVRTLFQFQGANITDSARVLGATGFGLFKRVTLPMARPAIILGVTLALMETINDIGAVEYLGTRTLTFSIFSVWLNQNDLAGAAQIALLLLLLVFFLIYIERMSRGTRKYHDQKAKKPDNKIERTKLNPIAGKAASLFCLVPVLTGFGIPVFILGSYAWMNLEDSLSADLISAFVTSISFGLIAAILAVGMAMFLTYAVRISNAPVLKFAVRVASSGYAVPGTLIALGIFLPLASFDNFLDGVMRANFGIATGLLLTGSGFAIIFAYVVRFIAMAEGNASNGFAKISPNIDMAAQNLGRTRSQVLRVVLLPIMRPAIAGAGLLVFVEVIKELSATIMLRPFGVNTLATHVYDYASQARVEDAALGCLLIVAAGIVPVIFLLRSDEK